MRNYYVIVVATLLVVFGMLLYPTVHFAISGGTGYSGLDKTGFLPLTAAAVTLLPYAFLGFVIYAIIKLSKR